MCPLLIEYCKNELPQAAISYPRQFGLSILLRAKRKAQVEGGRPEDDLAHILYQLNLRSKCTKFALNNLNAAQTPDSDRN